MTDIKRVIDGDTITDTEGKTRVGFINTPESVHTDSAKNTKEGDIASDFAKDMLPKGSKIRKHSYGADHFGRNVSGVKKVIGDVEVDYGLIAMDQEMSQYYTKYGTHPDPATHNEYRQYFSKDVPYQFGAPESAMTQEEFTDVHNKQEAFSDTYEAFKDGDATQEEFDKVTADLYGNPSAVARYREKLSNWNKPLDQVDPNTLRGAMRVAMEDPELRETYNQAVRNGHLMLTPEPAQEPSFWSNAKTTFSMMGSVSNAMDSDTLWGTRVHGSDFGVEEGELTAGVPEHLHSAVLAEADKYNDTSALVYRDQLIEDVQNRKQFDDMEWYAQLGYGAMTVIADPTTFIAMGPAAKAANSVRTWSASRALAHNIKGGQMMSALSAWTVAGGIEGAAFNAPRLAGDHTYTPKEYMLDTMFDAGFGLGIGGIVEGVAKPGLKYLTKVKASRKVEQQELANYHVARQEAEATGVRAPVPEAIQPIQTRVDATVAHTRLKNVLPQAEEVPWAAITEVTSGGFRAASNTLQQTIAKDSPLRKLINSQLGLNKRKLDPEQRAIADKLNADILHIVAAFPDGRIPANVNSAITAATFRQRRSRTNNAVSDILEGNISDVAGTLVKYVDSLKAQKELWKGYDPVPLSGDDLVRNNSEVLGREASLDDTSALTGIIPKEVSFLKDVVELNRMLRNSNDPLVTAQLEELNGMVSARIEQKELGDHVRYSDSRNSFGKTVAMTPPEMMAQLKTEGLKAGTPAFKSRMAELRKTGRVAVSDAVNEVGTLNQVDTGRVAASKYDDTDRGLDSDTDGLTGYQENFEQDLLPRGFTEVSTVKAFKDSSVQNLTTLREVLDKEIIRKLGVKRAIGKQDAVATRKRIETIKALLKLDKPKVIKRMVAAGKWQNVEDVIRASHELRAAAKARKLVADPDASAKKAAVRTSETETNDAALRQEEEEVLELNEEILEQVMIGDTSKLTGVETKALTDAYERLVAQSVAKVGNHIVDFASSGEKRAFELARKPTGILDQVGRLAGKLTEDLGSKFQNGKLTSLEYVGSRVTEIGRGYGGSMRRKATGGIIRDAVYKESMMKIGPQYFHAMDAYAASKGKGVFGKTFAQQSAGADSKVVRQFNEDVFLIQEYRRQGKELPELHSSVLKFVDEWNKFMDANHAKLVDANIGGFSKKRKVNNYIPHVWQSNKLSSAVRKFGKPQVLDLLTQGYLKSSHGAKSAVEARELAVRQFDWIESIGKRKKGDEVDQFMPVADSRAKARLEIDTTVELNGLRVMDLLDTDVINVGTKYANRMSGWIGYSKSTDGAVTSKLDIQSLRANIEQEGLEKGIDTSKYLKYFDDLENMMFGRPTRGGLPQEIRQLKDLTALTRMGGLGTAQLIETGQVVTRGVLSTFSSEPVVRKLLKVAKGSDAERDLIGDIQAISNITDDLEHLDRQSVHLDQAELESVKKIRQLSLYMADKATGGSSKAVASRLLGKTTAYNAIRRTQSRVTQASFVIDVAKHFKDGTGKMGNARMADVGLTNPDGTNSALKKVFNELVEYGDDGLVKRLNADKWPKSAREEFQYALLRDEAQQIQRTHIGELPPWMNSPVMSMIFQFRQMPIVATNKQLGRSLAFADKEAVAGVLLNTAFAGLVRFSKFAALGIGVTAITGQTWREPENEDQMDIQKYVAQFGIFADATDLVLDAHRASQSGEADEWGKLAGQIPVLGLMNDYKNAVPHGQGSKEQIDAAFGLLPLGNTAYGDMCHAWIQDTFGE